MPDQRHDGETRQRMDELAASFRAAVGRQDGRIGRFAMWLVVLTVAGLCASWLGYRANQQSNQQINAVALKARHDAAVTTKALCALRSDLERRVATSTEFLRDHPRGVAGIPAKTIRDGIRNQRRTVAALSGIACPK